ncbi:hypothetical protein PHB09_145 [Pseudomonas phage PHB09]|uniref:Uncharacterized protein n=1 Tax=Pseudomonas phage PHB09 TaxID=2867265 RepID=A0AAE8XD18_9CAUD|nr:hypothetical protein QGX10_gp144 [Pseudomonas phage PHB09]UAV84640.1 hypothetical protein PHB09_145 [Pseudomonas phage PHB09]
MKIVHYPATEAVTKIVEPAKPETFDLTGLTIEQMALITIFLANNYGCNSLGMYDTLIHACGFDNDSVPDIEGLHVSLATVVKLAESRALKK